MAEPVTTMTPWQYWRDWLIVGVVGLVLARWLLVQPIVDAIHALK